MLEEQSTYPGQLSSRATTRASPSLKGSSAKKRAARLGVSPSTVLLCVWKGEGLVRMSVDAVISAEVLFFSRDQEDNWVHIRTIHTIHTIYTLSNVGSVSGFMYLLLLFSVASVQASTSELYQCRFYSFIW